MNSDDKNSLRAFKSMFGALSRGIKRKFEEKAREREPLPFVTSARAAAPEEEPPALLSATRAANVVSIRGHNGTSS